MNFAVDSGDFVVLQFAAWTACVGCRWPLHSLQSPLAATPAQSFSRCALDPDPADSYH